jgi:hypothetical protein
MIMKSNLEPIEESDLDLEGKLKRGTVEGVFHDKEVPAFAVEKESPVEISAAEKDGAYGTILSKVQIKQNDEIDPSAVALDAELGSKLTTADSQVSHLIDIAQQKGVVHAVKVARHMEDNYILDTFHDKLLAEELHAALLSKGMIKEL